MRSNDHSGGGRFDLVRTTFWYAAILGSVVMAGLSLLCQLRPGFLVGPFVSSSGVETVAMTHLRIMSWNFVGSGLSFTRSALFQALGDTRPAFLSSTTRLLTFALPALWLAGRPDLNLEEIRHLSVASIGLQAVISLALLCYEFGRKLAADTAGSSRVQGTSP
jgi:Na+-driven multidrug efflux pump